MAPDRHTADAPMRRKRRSHENRNDGHANDLLNPMLPKTSVYDLFLPHLQSFNFAIGHGLHTAVRAMHTQCIDADPETALPSVRIWFESVTIGSPVRETAGIGAAVTGGEQRNDARILPNECRSLGISYAGPLMANISFQIGQKPVQTIQRRLGQVPIMVRSSKCHLQSYTKQQLIRAGEEDNEFGGYFILNGNERLIRLLIVPKRHYVMALVRPSYTNRGSEYSKFATQIRCVRPDQSSKSLTCHYLNSGSINVRFSLRKQEFFIPAILLFKAFTGATDQEIYDRIVEGQANNSFLTDRVELMLREGYRLQLYRRHDIIAHFGKVFRVLLRHPNSLSDFDVGVEVMRDNFFVHCMGESEDINNQRKFDILVHMVQKTYALAEGTIKADSADAVNGQEVLLPGHMYLMLLKEKLEDYLVAVKAQIMKDNNLRSEKVNFSDTKYLRQVLDMAPDVGKAIHYFLVTGNLKSNSGLDLMQVSGYTIAAEKLNYMRYIAHFRSVHRGQFFATMKTTDVRKLMPESFGFFCPVHTPDGAPCGLINHLTFVCQIPAQPLDTPHISISETLCTLGMSPLSDCLYSSNLPIIVDGIVTGKVHPSLAKKFIHDLRHLKVSNHPIIPSTMEIYPIFDNADGLFPAIYLYMTPARFMRPVRHLLPKGSVFELIGAQEQLTLDIGIRPSDFRPHETTHMEIAPNFMFSVVSSFTPFSDFNQSPRNMYQCQMGKQTMGTPFHAFTHRIDNKVFRLQTPQTPMVRSKTYEQFNVDEYPTGANAIVAVIAYTGYDMEDAMIINKSAYERGFAHASVYKYKSVDLRDLRMRGEPIHHHFSNQQTMFAGRKNSGKLPSQRISDRIDSDGLPRVGQLLRPKDTVYAVVNDVNNAVKQDAYTDMESAYIEDIRLLGDSSNELQHIGIKYRLNRNPSVGDKFASRAGQKGVLSILYPAIDMPFTDSGMTPDIIINPHAFPSRMTIGMLIESMAGKAGCMHGVKQDCTPFRFNEQYTAVEHFGQQLVAAGYSYAGTETLYSGISGVEIQAQIFIGCVYYQRLRHMVSDKAQVRSTGPINQTTRQPIKGRKVHGGIRFGEMERDSLLAHGVSYMLHDRLMNCSDYHTTYVCTLCGSMLAPLSMLKDGKSSVMCRHCQTASGCSLIAVPFIFQYMAFELAAMNMRLTLDIA